MHVHLSYTGCFRERWVLYEPKYLNVPLAAGVAKNKAQTFAQKTNPCQEWPGFLIFNPKPLKTMQINIKSSLAPNKCLDIV
jgi:hypothetical protein